MNEMGSSSQLVFLDRLPVGGKVFDPANSLLVFDGHLLKVSREFRLWVKQFPHRYQVESGEKLKDLSLFPEHFTRLLTLARSLSPRTMTVVAIGGGSVGDFAGFFASVFKRGVRLVHMPSTWLAAIDSAHGGKTALNAGKIKNMIGTFYPAEKVVLVRSLLLQQPNERIVDAMGELGKIALIDGGTWVRSLESSRLRGADLLWKFLKPAIQAKLKIVARDPQERKGARQVLNLGHTVGHIIEAAYQRSHGYAVGQGLFFALEFSRALGMLKTREFERAQRLLRDQLELQPRLPSKKLGTKIFREKLGQDKKKSSQDDVTFIFLRAFGKAERVSVPVEGIVSEAQRQGWVMDR